MGYYNNHTNDSHQSGMQKFLRALISIITSVGFGLFWYALVKGLADNVLFFVLGIILIVIGIIHIFIGIKKDLNYRRGY